MADLNENGIGLSCRSHLAISVQAARHSLELEEHSKTSSKLDAGDDHAQDQGASHNHQPSGCASDRRPGAVGTGAEYEGGTASEALVREIKENSAKCCYMCDLVVSKKTLS